MAIGDFLNGAPILRGLGGTSNVTRSAGAHECIMSVFWCADTTAGTVTITPTGGSAYIITVPASSGWMGRSYALEQLPTGSTVAFSGVAAHVVEFCAGRSA